MLGSLAGVLASIGAGVLDVLGATGLDSTVSGVLAEMGTSVGASMGAGSFAASTGVLAWLASAGVPSLPPTSFSSRS